MNQNTIFVTGAGAGIGKATATHFWRHGWFVGLYDIDGDSVRTIEEELGGHVCSGPVDVTDPDSVRAAMTDFTKHTGGTMHVLLNNAGILRTGPFHEIALEDHRKILETNNQGMVNCAYLAFPWLRSTTQSRLINMASASAIYGVPEFASYSASKFFVRGLTEALDLEWERYGIAVCDILPPFVRTAMVEAEKDKNTLVKALGVELSADDVAETVWAAAHGMRLHWTMTTNTKLLMAAAGYLPEGASRRAVKRIIGY